MQKVTILCVGKLKEKFYIDAAAEYVKRLSRFCKLELVELPEERLPEDPSFARTGNRPSERRPDRGGPFEGGCCHPGQAPIRRRPDRSVRGGRAAVQRGAGPADGCLGQPGRGTSGVSHRWVLWPAPLHQSRGQAAALHVSHDLPPPSGPGDGAGTDLPGVSDQRRHQISQVKDVEL